MATYAEDTAPEPASLLGIDHGQAKRPAWFKDLFLDQIVARACLERSEYRLEPFFHARPKKAAQIAHRQDIVHDLEQPAIRTAVGAFASGMRRMRAATQLEAQHRHPLQKRMRSAEAAVHYMAAVKELAAFLSAAPTASAGLRACAEALATYVADPLFRALDDEGRSLAEALRSIRYCVLIDGLEVLISPTVDAFDLGSDVEQTYARFDQGGREQFAFPVYRERDLGIIEERIVEEVARAFPVQFDALARFAERLRQPYRDPRIELLDRELQFFAAYLDLIAPLRAAGLRFCRPEVSDAKAVAVAAGFDLALALSLVGTDGKIVTNDLELAGAERILVVSGPNQGGKTTFARMFGQIHHLGCLGLPVPGYSARLHLFDEILTHFERREAVSSPHGKLQEELVRMHEILERATSDSILIFNELFASTTFRDAFGLSRHVHERLAELDCLCVWISFIDDLSNLGETMVSMVSTVDRQDPARRTFRIERRRADGLAYARAIATKYGLTPEALRRRLAR